MMSVLQLNLKLILPILYTQEIHWAVSIKTDTPHGKAVCEVNWS